MSIEKTITQLNIEYVKKFSPCVSDEEALEMYEVFRSYRDEGQSLALSRMYAGFPSPEDTGEY